jgi:hypothetical protein
VDNLKATATRPSPSPTHLPLEYSRCQLQHDSDPSRARDELPGLRGPSPRCCSIPPPPPPNAAAAVRTRTAALLPLAAPTTAGDARGSVGGTESEAMRHERGERRIAEGVRGRRARSGFTRARWPLPLPARRRVSRRGLGRGPGRRAGGCVESGSHR